MVVPKEPLLKAIIVCQYSLVRMGLFGILSILDAFVHQEL